MTLAKPPSTRAATSNASSAATNAVLAHSTLPALVFGCPITAPQWPHDTVVDLRALDVPVSDVAMRNAVRAAWQASSQLTVRVDGAPSAQVLALLHGLVRRELRWGPAEVERFDERHRVVALTDAQTPSPALLALFVARVRAPRASGPSAPSGLQKTGSTHAR